MENIGLINECLTLSNAIWSANNLLMQSQECYLLNNNLDDFLLFLKKVEKTNDIIQIISIENLILKYELDFYANALEEVNSIKAALTQINEAKKLFELIYDHSTYSSITDSYSSKNKEVGLPLDAFRVFIKSHTARLTNRLTSPLSATEKNLLRQRKENLKVAQGIYVELQCKALGMV